MCYPPPGPRCSSHANAEWLKTLALLEKETDANKRIRLQMKADEAKRAFNATPRGQNRLLREISALANNPENKDEIAKLSLQLRDGQLARKNQFDAFLAVKNSKETNIKTLLKTTNKQEQAVGIAFHVLMRFLPETLGDDTHIISDNMIQTGDSKILCLPQKHQRYFGNIKEEDNGYLSSGDLPVELLDIFADFSEPSTITPNYIAHLSDWFVSQLKVQGVMFLAIVDVKTENLMLTSIDSLANHYDVSFLQKRKLGGTAPYIHGDTELLRDAIAQTPLEGCGITVVTVKGQKHTYILDTPYLEPQECQSLYFYFAEKQTGDGSRFHEVRTRHQSSQKEIFIKLSRKTLVISKTDEGQIKRFILENLGSDTATASAE
jgi:hypothetical protein